MSDHHKLSLRSAILINLNVMVGFGIFVNTVVLSKYAGFLGFVAYALVAILILPLIMSIAELMRHYPSGGFYNYGAQTIHPFAGFISAWIYFTGKLASAALIIHVVMTLLQNLIPLLKTVPTLALDTITIAIFTFLNTYNIKVGSSIAALFFSLKMTPILFAILSSLYLLSSATADPSTFLWNGIPTGIPFVLYAFTGFEAACSLSKSIENAHINGPRAIMISYILAVCVNVIYQLLFFAVTHGALMTQENYLGAFPTLLANLIPHNPLIAQKIVGILHIAIACSALGGSYGILLSNHWNLHILAHHNHTFFKDLLTKLNSHAIPVAGVIIEALVCITYLFLTNGDQATLQQLSALGSTLAYTISVLGLITAMQQQSLQTLSPWIPKLALGSCLIFITLTIKNFIVAGPQALLFPATLLIFGIFMFSATKSRAEQ